jgi:hypothetical protein
MSPAEKARLLEMSKALAYRSKVPLTVEHVTQVISVQTRNAPIVASTSLSCPFSS